MGAEELRASITALIQQYCDEAFAPKPFVPGESPVPVSGRGFDAADVSMLIDSSLDFWLTTGRVAAEFEERFAKGMGARHALLVNSGSSANPLAVSPLKSPKLPKREL